MIDKRFSIEEDLVHSAAHAAAEPIIHNIYCKTALLSLQYLSGKEGSTNSAVQPLPRAVSHLKIGGQFLNVLHDFLVQIRHSNFQAVGHRQLIGIHQEFVRKSGSQFQKLETTKFIGSTRQVPELLPALQYLLPRITTQHAIMK